MAWPCRTIQPVEIALKTAARKAAEHGKEKNQENALAFRISSVRSVIGSRSTQEASLRMGMGTYLTVYILLAVIKKRFGIAELRNVYLM